MPKASAARFTQPDLRFGFLAISAQATPQHFDWDAVAPSCISSFVPNLEAELGLALMFASMIPIYWRAGRKRP
jgi:hypothetical protein